MIACIDNPSARAHRVKRAELRAAQVKRATPIAPSQEIKFKEFLRFCYQITDQLSQIICSMSDYDSVLTKND